MKVKIHITETTADYFLSTGVKFIELGKDPDENYIVEVTIENGMDLYNIYDAGRAYGRDLPNGF
jgi:hypothetical protein